MKLYALTGLVLVSVTAQAQGIYFGAVKKEKKQNEFCSYNVTVPKLMADPNASEGVKSLVDALNAKSTLTVAQMEHDFDLAVKESQACSSLEYSNQTGIDFHIANDLGAKVVSLYTVESGFSGGAHGWATISTETFNTETGEEYKSLGAFLDQSKLPAVKDLILQKVKESDQYFDQTFGWDDWSKQRVLMDQFTNFYVSNSGIVIYFQQYEIASYAEGMIEVTLGWEDLKKIGLNGSDAASALLSNMPMEF
jgi:hypothetical protein